MYRYIILFLCLFSCIPSELKFKSIIEDKHFNDEPCESTKKWVFEGEIDSKNCKFEYKVVFGKRWIHNKSQWIPLHGAFQYLASSGSDFHLIPYQPVIKFQQDEEGWVSYDFELRIVVANAIKNEFRQPSPLKFDYFQFTKELDDIAGFKTNTIEFPKLDYQNIDTTNSATIIKHFHCQNTQNELIIQDLKQTKKSLEKVLALNGMGNININEYSNYTNSIPNDHPNIAGAIELVQIQGSIGGYRFYCFDLEKFKKYQNNKLKP